ncbi:MAG: hypothetical protein AAFP69_24175 [Planctomycetota bacterium]
MPCPAPPICAAPLPAGMFIAPAPSIDGMLLPVPVTPPFVATRGLPPTGGTAAVRVPDVGNAGL